MNTLKIVSLAFASTLVITSCNTKTQEKTPETVQVLNENLALTAQTETTETLTDAAETANLATYLYVTARTGLSLREYNNLRSEKLAIMPYGSRLKVLEKEPNATMKVQHIKGGMDKVSFNRKTGFAFNGYLSRFFPPDQGMLPKAYAAELKKDFPKVAFKEVVQGTASKPINVETLILPEASWHEAYFIAQQTFNIPERFVYPNPKGAVKDKVRGLSSKDDNWFEALHINRDNVGFTELAYKYESAKNSRYVTITKVKEGIKIEQKLAYK